MATLTVYSDGALDGLINSIHATYATARAGAGLAADAEGNSFSVGQMSGGGNYQCTEGFLVFDTSPLGAGAVISAAVLEMDMSTDDSDTDFTVEVRLHDWGASLTTADWVAGASLAGLTLLASKSTLGWTEDIYVALTESGTNLRSNINKTGMTRVLVCSSRHRGNNTPSGLELVSLRSGDYEPFNRPRLTITYTAGVTHLAAAALTATVSLAALGQAIKQAAQALSASASLSATSVATKHGAAAASLAIALATTAQMSRTSSVEMPATATLSADGQVGAILGQAALALAMTLAARAGLTQHAQQAIAASVTLQSEGVLGRPPPLILKGVRPQAGSGSYGILPPAGTGRRR